MVLMPFDLRMLPLLEVAVLMMGLIVGEEGAIVA
jgi:hypothetical protein